MSMLRRILSRRSSITTVRYVDASTNTTDADAEAAVVNEKAVSKSNLKTASDEKQISKSNRVDYRPYIPDETDATKENNDITDGVDDGSEVVVLSSESSESTVSQKEFEELLVNKRMRRLVAKIEKLRNSRDRLRRRQNDVISLEKEIRHVVQLINQTRMQSQALKQDVLARKCELKFLATLVPEGFDMEAKKKEPIVYKKYGVIKSAGDARNLLVIIREKMNALEHMEAMTYSRLMDFQHGLKSSQVKKTFAFMMQKDKGGKFDHVSACIRPASAVFKTTGTTPPTSPIQTSTNQTKLTIATPTQGNTENDEIDSSDMPPITTITVESPSMFTPDVTSSTPATPPPPPPIFPRHVFSGPFSPLHPRPETLL